MTDAIYPVRVDTSLATRQEAQMHRQKRSTLRRVSGRIGGGVLARAGGFVAGAATTAGAISRMRSGPVDPIGEYLGLLESSATYWSGAYKATASNKARDLVRNRHARKSGMTASTSVAQRDQEFEYREAELMERGRAILRGTPGFGIITPGLTEMVIDAEINSKEYKTYGAAFMEIVIKGYIDLFLKSFEYIKDGGN